MKTINHQKITNNLIAEIKLMEDEARNKKIELAKIVAKDFLKKFREKLPNDGSLLLKLKIQNDEISEYSKDNNLNCLEYLILLGFLNKNSPKPVFHEFLIQIPKKHQIREISQKEISEIITKINNVTHGILIIGFYGKLSYSSELKFQGENLTVKGCYKFN